MSGIYGVYQVAPNLLATKEPSSYLDYTESVAALLTDPVTGVVDPLLSLTLASKPSGTGELVASRLSVDPTGLLVTWWLADGVPGRSYTLSLVAVTQAGRTLQALMTVPCDPTLAVWPPPAPPSADFSAPITWAAA